MATTKESPVILSLCTGLLRGLEVGIEHALQQRIRVAAYAEIEAFIIENLLCGMEKGFLDPAPIWTDLKTFPFSYFHGNIHGIIGGYPCQPFSVAGNQKGTEDPRHLWPYIKDGIEAIRPVFCFFENVRGHLNLGYEQVRRELQELGYEVREGIYSAEEVGAPHRRDRLFILAIRRDILSQFNECMVNADGNGSQGLCAENSRENDSERRKECSETFGVNGAGAASSGLSENETRIEIVGNTNSTPATYEVPAGRTESGISGKKLADTCVSDVQRSFARKYESINRKEQRERSSGSQGCFPARPGQYQYDWEHPRVVKPSLGITIDGYNFREDLLRGAGNGVVWQTASLAFSDLLTKF